MRFSKLFVLFGDSHAGGHGRLRPGGPGAPADARPDAGAGRTRPDLELLQPLDLGDRQFPGGRRHERDRETCRARACGSRSSGFQAIVDPYARADFFISFSEEGANVEEGYLTFTSLPWDLLVKVGRMRLSFGKINTLHLHVLPVARRSRFPIVNLLGGEEGWSGDGVSVAKLIPLGDTFSEATLQVFRGESEGLFTAAKRADLAFNGHYRVFADLSDSTNLDLGLSYGLGPNGTSPNAKTRLSALDATFRWKPLRTGLYRQVVLRGELFRSSRDQAGGTENATGWFAAG